MQLFVDTAEIEAVRELKGLGLVDGVNTNPTLIRRSGRDFAEVIREISAEIDGPVSAGVVATDFEGMREEAEKIVNIAKNVCVKVPMTWDGLKLCRLLSDRDVKVNVTLCFSANQALLAAKAGAHFVSPFVGRLDEINVDGMQLIRDIRVIYDNYAFDTAILGACVRTLNHVTQCAIIGADVASCPPELLRNLSNHPLTDEGLARFRTDWETAEQSLRGEAPAQDEDNAHDPD